MASVTFSPCWMPPLTATMGESIQSSGQRNEACRGEICSLRSAFDLSDLRVRMNHYDVHFWITLTTELFSGGQSRT